MNQEPSVAEKLQVQRARKPALHQRKEMGREEHRERESGWGERGETWEVSLTEIGHLMLKCTVDSPCHSTEQGKKSPCALFINYMEERGGHVTVLLRTRHLYFFSLSQKRQAQGMLAEEPDFCGSQSLLL